MNGEIEVATPLNSGDAYVLCDVAGTLYAVDTRVVEQLEMVGTLTGVPNAPAYVDGVTASRGKVIPVVNLRARFGFPRATSDSRARIIVTRVDARVVGLLVDSAREFTRIPADAVQRAPDALDAAAPYIRGVAHLGERLILVLDVPALLGTTATPALPVSAPSASGTLPAAV